MARPRRIDFPDALCHRLQSYPWSSYPGYLDAKQAQEFACSDVLYEYGAVARNYGIDPAALKERGHRAGPARAWRWSWRDLSGRAVGEHYGVGSGAVSAIHRKVEEDRHDVLFVVNSLALRLQSKRQRRNR
ncbi:MAG: hypothetical protein ACLP9L_33110 [Thermoguttaceae bacterium]